MRAASQTYFKSLALHKSELSSSEGLTGIKSVAVLLVFLAVIGSFVL